MEAARRYRWVTNAAIGYDSQTIWCVLTLPTTDNRHQDGACFSQLLRAVLGPKALVLYRLGRWKSGWCQEMAGASEMKGGRSWMTPGSPSGRGWRIFEWLIRGLSGGGWGGSHDFGCRRSRRRWFLDSPPRRLASWSLGKGTRFDELVFDAFSVIRK